MMLKMTNRGEYPIKFEKYVKAEIREHSHYQDYIHFYNFHCKLFIKFYNIHL
jgi:hypothetical protein